MLMVIVCRIVIATGAAYCSEPAAPLEALSMALAVNDVFHREFNRKCTPATVFLADKPPLNVDTKPLKYVVCSDETEKQNGR